MRRVLIVVGAVLVAAGLGLIVAATIAPDSAPPAWLGVLVGVVGLPVLYAGAARRAIERFDAGEWVPATGIVVGRAAGGVGHADALRVRLSCPQHGEFVAVVAMNSAQDRRRDLQARGTPIVGRVRSNDRRVVELHTVGGVSWPLID